MNKTFLTSSLIIGLTVSPAIADTLYKDTNIGDSCTADFLGSDSGNAVNSFLAQYTPNNYPVNAGEYLAQNGTTGTQCPANSYCPGNTTYTFSETADQGINSCPDSYSLSAAGASAQTDCYRTCTTNDVAHSTAVSGGYYYGDNNQCGATSCASGWHIKQTGVNLTEAFGTKAGVNSAYASISNDGTYRPAPAAIHDQDYYGITEANEWAVAFDNGLVKGRALCSTQSGTGVWTIPRAANASEVTTFANLTDETGQEGARYCYCNLTGYGDGNGNNISLSSPWVFNNGYGDADYCAPSCASDCANYVRYTDSGYLVFRAALFGSATTSGPAVCEANEITITWKPANGQADIENTCTYSGDITLPTAPVKTGYTFSGWKLVTGSSSN